MATVQIRVDDALKSRVDELYSTLGLDTTTAVRMFFMASPKLPNLHVTERMM